MRRDYYKHYQEYESKPFESKSKFDHDGKPIPINSVDSLHELAMDYLSVKRGGAYYEAFEYTLKMIDVLKRQSRAIEEVHKNFTV